MVAQPVWIVGAPADEPLLYRSGYVSGYVTEHGQRAILLQLPIFFGDSGSGIMDSHACIVGVVTGSETLSQAGVHDAFTVALPLAFTPAQWA